MLTCVVLEVDWNEGGILAVCSWFNYRTSLCPTFWIITMRSVRGAKEMPHAWGSAWGMTDPGQLSQRTHAVMPECRVQSKTTLLPSSGGVAQARCVWMDGWFLRALHMLDPLSACHPWQFSGSCREGLLLLQAVVFWAGQCRLQRLCLFF